MTTTNSSTDIIDQISPCKSHVHQNCPRIETLDLVSALALDMTIKEIEQNGHEDERMVLVFNAFDQIIPQLGVFSPLAGKLRNEFFGNLFPFIATARLESICACRFHLQ